MSPLRRTIGRSVLGLYRFASRVWCKAFSLGVGGAFQEFGARSVIQLPVRLGGTARIVIGSDVFIGAGSWLQTLDAAGGGSIRIGGGTSFAGSCVVSAASSIEIGHHVLFARNVYVSDHAHGFGDADRPIIEQGVMGVQPVVIEDGAWIGQNVVVLPGVHIGRGAVIGANSVVGSDVPDRCVAVGAPARVVRTIDGEASVPADALA